MNDSSSKARNRSSEETGRNDTTTIKMEGAEGLEVAVRNDT